MSLVALSDMPSAIQSGNLTSYADDKNDMLETKRPS